MPIAEFALYALISIFLLIGILLFVQLLFRKGAPSQNNNVDVKILPVGTVITLAAAAGGMAGFVGGMVKTQFAYEHEIARLQQVGDDKLKQIASNIFNELKVQKLQVVDADGKVRAVIENESQSGRLRLLGSDQQPCIELSSQNGVVVKIFSSEHHVTAAISSNTTGGLLSINDQREKSMVTLDGNGLGGKMSVFNSNDNNTFLVQHNGDTRGVSVNFGDGSGPRGSSYIHFAGDRKFHYKLGAEDK